MERQSVQISLWMEVKRMKKGAPKRRQERQRQREKRRCLSHECICDTHKVLINILTSPHLQRCSSRESERKREWIKQTKKYTGHQNAARSRMQANGRLNEWMKGGRGRIQKEEKEGKKRENRKRRRMKSERETAGWRHTTEAAAKSAEAFSLELYRKGK